MEVYLLKRDNELSLSTAWKALVRWLLALVKHHKTSSNLKLTNPKQPNKKNTTSNVSMHLSLTIKSLIISWTILSKRKRVMAREVIHMAAGPTLSCTIKREPVLSKRRIRWRIDNPMHRALSMLCLSIQSNFDWFLSFSFSLVSHLRKENF